MSAQDDNAATIAEDLSLLVSNYCASAGSVLVLYEYIITFGQEVDLFWTGQWTGAAALFFFNRYLSFVLNLYGIAGNAPMSDSVFVCPSEARANKAIDILQYLPWAVFSALRALALSRNRSLSLFVFVLSSVPLGINYSHFGMGLTVTIVSRTSLITADVLLIWITWANLYRRGGLRHAMEMNRFIAVLLRDGTIYFVVLLFLNALHLTLSMLSIEYSVRNVSYVTQFSEPITTILVSRFLLHLQSAKRKSLNITSSGTLAVTAYEPGSLVFNERIIGSLGSHLSFPGEYDKYKYVDGKDDDNMEADVRTVSEDQVLATEDAGRPPTQNRVADVELVEMGTSPLPESRV